MTGAIRAQARRADGGGLLLRRGAARSAYDLPPGWEMTLDERLRGSAARRRRGEPVFFRSRRVLSHDGASNDRGEDVTCEAIRAECRRRRPAARPRRPSLHRPDRSARGDAQVRPAARRARFSLTLRFDGWVEYAYSQIGVRGVAGGESSLRRSRRVEARGADGEWARSSPTGSATRPARRGSARRRSIAGRGAPRVGPRRCGCPPTCKSTGTAWRRRGGAVRRGAVGRAGEAALAATVARRRLLRAGDVTRTVTAVYDYDRRPPHSATPGTRAGYYTAFRRRRSLWSRGSDDAVAIIGPGEEVHLEFAAPRSRRPPSGGLDPAMGPRADGWCKDADLFTQDSGTVGPLPRARTGGTRSDPDRGVTTLHAEYNTRFRERLLISSVACPLLPRPRRRLPTPRDGRAHETQAKYRPAITPGLRPVSSGWCLVLTALHRRQLGLPGRGDTASKRWTERVAPGLLLPVHVPRAPGARVCC